MVICLMLDWKACQLMMSYIHAGVRTQLAVKHRRKGKTAPIGISLMRSQVLYRADQDSESTQTFRRSCTGVSASTKKTAGLFSFCFEPSRGNFTIPRILKYVHVSTYVRRLLHQGACALVIWASSPSCLLHVDYFNACLWQQTLNWSGTPPPPPHL